METIILISTQLDYKKFWEQNQEVWVVNKLTVFNLPEDKTINKFRGQVTQARQEFIDQLNQNSTSTENFEVDWPILDGLMSYILEKLHPKTHQIAVREQTRPMYTLIHSFTF